MTSRGHDVLALDSDQLIAALSDEEVLRLAARERRILVTHNVKDFVPLIREVAEAGRSHPGCILVLLPSNAYGAILRGLDLLFRDRPAERDWVDRVEFLAG